MFITILDQTYFLAWFDRNLDPNYVTPLKTSGPGYEVLQAFAKVAERLSTAGVVLDQGSFILTATGGAKATALIAFYRPLGPLLPLFMRKGTVVGTAQGRNYITLEDAFFDAGELTTDQVNTPVEAVNAGMEYNIPGPITAADGSTLEGDISILIFPYQTLPTDAQPTYIDATIAVQQVTAATGGVCSFLDQLGEDRGLPRHLEESDIQYRARIKSLPSTQTPDALIMALQAIFTPLGVTFQFIETFDLTFQTCWNAPLTPSPEVFSTQTFSSTTTPALGYPFRTDGLGRR